MASRNIAITEDLYNELERRKMNNESFTRVIYRIMEENEKPSRYFGAWSDLSEDEKRIMENKRNKLRDLWKDRGMT
jgi:predicted CopG family antitoxin